MDNESFNKIMSLLRVLFDTSVDKKYLPNDYSYQYQRSLFSDWQIDYMKSFEKFSYNDSQLTSIPHTYGYSKLIMAKINTVVIHEDWKRFILNYLISIYREDIKKLYDTIVNRKFENLPAYSFRINEDKTKFEVLDKTVYKFFESSVTNFPQVFRILDFCRVGHRNSNYNDVISITELKELTNTEKSYKYQILSDIDTNS